MHGSLTMCHELRYLIYKSLLCFLVDFMFLGSEIHQLHIDFLKT